MQDIIHHPQYVAPQDVQTIKQWYHDVVADDFSGGPHHTDTMQWGMSGCWDRPLRLDRPDCPLTPVIHRLQQDFGPFEIHNCSIRYLAFPFGPHSDIRSTEWLQTYRRDWLRGYTFLIPLSWRDDYQPGTAFFSSPPQDDEPLYEECGDVLPQYADTHRSQAKNFSVKRIVQWQHAGDLVAWMNFQWHCSTSPQGYHYHNDPTLAAKEFISIETYRPRLG